MSKTGGLWGAFFRELSLLKSNKRFSLGMILLPILSFVFLVALFSDSSIHNIPIAVVDNDHSNISRTYIRMVDATAGVSVKYEPQNVEQAEELMLKGEVDAILYIPKDMEKDLYSTTITEPKLYISGMRILNSSLIYRDVLMTTQTLSSGIEIQLLTKNGISQEKAYELMLPVYYEKHILFNPYTSYGYYLISPFNTLMLILFALLSTLFAVGLEIKKGSVNHWLESASNSIYKAVFGKAIPYTILYTTLSILSNVYIFYVLGAPLNGSFLMLTISTIVVILSYQAFGLILLAITGKLGLALSAGAALSTMSFTMSGLTFPLMAMSPLIFSFAHLFPYTHYMYCYISQMRGASVTHCLPYIVTMLLYPIILAIMIPRLIKICKQNSND